MDLQHARFRHQAPLAALTFIATTLFSAAAFAQGIDIDDDRALLSPPAIAVRNGTLFYDGQIASGAADAVHQQLEMRRVEKISINSIGGDAAEAMTIGREIHKRRVDVEVRTVCAAACANYIFPAARNKFISQTAYLLWHGSLHSPAQEIVLEPGDADATVDKLLADPQFKALQAQETAFYQAIGVNGDLPWCPQRQPDYRQKFPEKWFSWTHADLARFGVNGVRFTTSAARWQRDMTARGVIFADYCG